MNTENAPTTLDQKTTHAARQAAMAVVFGESIPVAANTHGVTQEAVANALGSAKSVRGVYALYCPIRNTVRYVGSSDDCNKRFAQHKRINGTRANNTTWLRWLADLAGQDLQMKMVILAVVHGGNAGFSEMETYWIGRYRQIGQADLNLNLVANRGKKDQS